jgi:hypothetical protein
MALVEGFAAAEEGGMREALTALLHAALVAPITGAMVVGVAEPPTPKCFTEARDEALGLDMCELLEPYLERTKLPGLHLLGRVVEEPLYVALLREVEAARNAHDNAWQHARAPCCWPGMSGSPAGRRAARLALAQRDEPLFDNGPGRAQRGRVRWAAAHLEPLCRLRTQRSFRGPGVGAGSSPNTSTTMSSSRRMELRSFCQRRSMDTRPSTLVKMDPSLRTTS